MARPTVWFNQGYSSLRDALLLIRRGAGGRVRLLASHADDAAPIRVAADESFDEPSIHRGCSTGEDAYVDWCLETCRRRSIELFAPQAGRTAVARSAAAFKAAGVRLSLAGDADTLALIEDKGRFYTASALAGLPTPWTREVGGPEAFDAALADLHALDLAACIKPPVGVFGAGYWRLTSATPLFAQLMDPDARRLRPAVLRQALAEASAPRLLVMEHLPGSEWSVDAVCADGRTLAAVGRRKHGARQRLEVEGPALALAARVAATFRLSGLVNIQLKAADADGEDLRVLEVNPRVSGGCAYTALTGVNLPWLWIAAELGLPADAPSKPTACWIAPVNDATTLDIAPARSLSTLLQAPAHA